MNKVFTRPLSAYWKNKRLATTRRNWVRLRERRLNLMHRSWRLYLPEVRQ